MAREPGPFGWVSNLLRWGDGDQHIIGQGGPLPPPRAKPTDNTEHELYQGLADGWLHGTVGAALSSFFSEPRTRKELYVLYEKMDMTDVAGSILDLYAEDATQPDHDSQRLVWVEGPDAIMAECDELFRRLKYEEELPGITRDVAKFGDDFERLVYNSGPQGGIKRMIPVPPITITRKEDKEGKLEGYLQTGKQFRNENNPISYPWDFAHFRLRGRDRRYPYGTSILHNAIRPWKQLIILEDWMIGYQINRHPDRNIIMVDIGSASDVEATDVARRFRQKLKRHMIIDPGSTTQRGSLGYSYDPMTPMEDLVLPIRPESQTRIEKLTGSANAMDIGPIQFVLDKFYAGVRAPKSFFGIDYSSGMPMNMKASLTNQDVRYARGVARLQRCMIAGTRYLCELNLMLKMSAGETGVADNLKSVLDWKQPGNDFTVNMGKVSYLEELERLEVEQLRQQVALSMLELSANNPAIDVVRWTNYVLREIVQVPEDQLSQMIQSEIDPEKADALRFNQPQMHPDTAGPQKEARAEATRKAGNDFDLGRKEKVALSEVIARSPRLRAAMANSHRVNKVLRATEDADGITESGASVGSNLLPTRDNELFKKGLLKDNLSEKDVAEILGEVTDG